MKTLMFCACLVIAAPAIAQTAGSGANAATAQTEALSTSSPIEALASSEITKAAIQENMPDLLTHDAYDLFKHMTLAELAPLSGGIITDEKIAAVQAVIDASGN